MGPGRVARDVPSGVVDAVKEHWDRICEEWDALYPANPVGAEGPGRLGEREDRATLPLFEEGAHWLQSPDWQFNGGEPMIFVGQVDPGPTYHDRSVLYVFVDASEKSAKWVIQSA
jgi:hypothetical protein